MHIGIDGNEANVPKKVGISEYAFELLQQFAKIPSSANFTIYLKEAPGSELPSERKGWQYKIVAPKRLWTQFGLPLDLFLHKPAPDVFFTPTHYAPRFSPMPVAIAIMDLSYIHYPELFTASDLYQLTHWTRYSVRKAKKIFTISLASKNDIIKTYGVSKDRVVVTYPGIKPMQGSKTTQHMDIKSKYGIEGTYILFVGTLQPRKNIARLIEAFAKICDSIDELVIVGKKGWMYEEILNAPKKFDVEKKVRFLEYVPDEDLPLLYKNAVCFILPSLYEGFGLPVLEAMVHGCPVIVSNVSSLPEAGGDAAVYVDPLSVTDMAEKLQKVIKSEKLRKEMVKKGLQQVKKFSWEKTARETLAVLESMTT